MTQQILQLIDQLLEAWNSHDPVRVASWYTEDCHGLDVAIARPQTGREGIQRMFEEYYRAFPDLKVSQEEIIVDENRVALFWTAQGTHRGAILNIPATGHCFAVRGVNRLLLRDGKVCETLTIWDVAGMLRALGLLPDL